MIKTNIAFSQVREDPEIDLFILNSVQKKEKNVLMIGSGGCSVLSILLSPDLNRVDVIDSNINQIELIKLKIEALKQLSTMDYIYFVESDINFNIGLNLDIPRCLIRVKSEFKPRIHFKHNLTSNRRKYIIC